MAFIPLTGGGSLVDNIIDRFQDEPGFDFIAYTDAQQVTGELFRELIGPDFEPYKDLSTYAEIQAIPEAIALVDASTNAQKIIAGITETVTGFVIDEPTVNAYTGNDGFILLSITNSISTPEASTLQYRINDGGWNAASTVTADTIDTTYVVIPDLDNNTTYKVDVRQSLFGTQSKVLTLNLTTTPTTENWKSFFGNQTDRDYFYSDSYTNGNTYGLNGKTVMEMVFGSAPMIDAIYGDNQTISLVDQELNNLSTLAASEQGMVGLANNTNSFEHAISTPAYMTAIDNVDLATRILILEQTATQNYANFTNVADFIDDETAMTEVASSQNAMRALVAGTNVEAELVLEPIALNEVFANLQATLIMANNPTAVEEVASSTTAMNLVDANDELLRIFLLELTDKDYTTYADVNAVLADNTAIDSILAVAETTTIGIISSITGFANVQTIMNTIAASQTIMGNVSSSETAMLNIANSTIAFNEVLASQNAITAIEQNDLALRILVLEQTNQDYTQFNDFNAVTASATAMTAVTASTTAMTAVAASATAMTAVAASTTAFNTVIASATAMTTIDQNDLALRILVLEQTNQDYTQFANFNAVIASATAFNAVIASTTALNAVTASETAFNAVIASETAFNTVVLNSNAIQAFIESDSNALKISQSQAAKDAISNNLITLSQSIPDGFNSQLIVDLVYLSDNVSTFFSQLSSSSLIVETPKNVGPQSWSTGVRVPVILPNDDHLFGIIILEYQSNTNYPNTYRPAAEFTFPENSLINFPTFSTSFQDVGAAFYKNAEVFGNQGPGSVGPIALRYIKTSFAFDRP